MTTFFNNLKLWLTKNWNTTAVGAVILLVLTYLVTKGVLTVDSKEFIIGLLSAIGFALSKDGNKTGV